jgi:DNA-binding SARP family transcriptional activator/tetratricopeptide (TPR) repeat protein
MAAGQPPAPTRVHLAGPLSVEVDGAPLAAAALGSRKARTVLGMLAASGTAAVGLADLEAALWPDVAPADPAAVLASLVSRLRRVLGAAGIVGGRGGYRLGPAVEVDVALARGLIEEAERRQAGQPGLAASAAERARQLLGSGAVLPDEDGDWSEVVRAEVSVLRRRARHALAAGALATGQAELAEQVAADATRADPLDEAATRLQMSAAAAGGAPARSLAVYDRLRAALADQLGTDPAPATQELHLALLRAGTATAAAVEPPRRVTAAGDRWTLAGRDEELALLAGIWTQATSALGRRVLVLGEAGIGKSRLVQELAALAARTGGVVSTARCYEAERSLFAQPIIDVLGALTSRLPATRVAQLAGHHDVQLAALVPEIATVLRPAAAARVSLATAQQRAFEAVASFLDGLSRDAPLLITIDDLQHAGRSTVELVHYLGRRLANAPVLVAATLREDEGRTVLDLLADGSAVLTLPPLSADAVAVLAASVGQHARAGEISRRTGGNSLFVVETLRALAQGQSGVPESLQRAVLDRAQRVGADAERVLRAGAVLGAAFEPRMAAALTGMPEDATLECCERALRAHLLVPAGAQYEFAHDAVREVLLVSTPSPTLVAHHRKAADLLAERPEAVAVHAAACGDLGRAGRAWLLAAEQALGRFVAGDAEALATRAIGVASELDDHELLGRALLVRGRALDAAAEYARALRDFERALLAARAGRDHRLEMAALRQLAGDVPVALGRPPAECEVPLRQGLALAQGLGDRGIEADVLGRLSVLACSRLDFTAALDLARRAERAGHASGDEQALISGLDALKAGYAYLGDVSALAPVVAELETLVRRSGDWWLLQWVVFEAAFVPLAAGNYDMTVAGMQEAIDVCRRSGFTAQEPFFVAHLGWVERLRGNLDAALATGRRAAAMAENLRHAWWSTTAAALLAGTLLASGDAAAAVPMLRTARDRADVPGAEAYLLRALGPLAEASGDAAVVQDADELLRCVRTPPERAWLLGADAYLSIARAWMAHGEPDRAASVLREFRTAASSCGWPALVALADSAAAVERS